MKIKKSMQSTRLGLVLCELLRKLQSKLKCQLFYFSLQLCSTTIVVYLTLKHNLFFFCHRLRRTITRLRDTPVTRIQDVDSESGRFPAKSAAAAAAAVAMLKHFAST